MNESYIKALVHQAIEQFTYSRKHKRLGKVTSYDPKKYAVKIQFWPYDDQDADNAESGWIPLEVQATGNGFGVYHAPNVGDLVETGFQEGDHMTARVSSRHVTEQAEVPYEIPAGEYHMVHKSGAVTRMLKDGTVFIGGAGTVPPPTTNPNAQSNTGGNAPDQSQQQAQQPQAKQAVTMHPDGKMTVQTPNGNYELTSGKDVKIVPGDGKVYIG